MTLQDMKDRNVELEESENSLKEVRNQLSDIQEREEKLKKEVIQESSIIILYMYSTSA